MNKSLLTNLIAILMIVASQFVNVYQEHVFYTGVFALSGAITNWLAIHMLFEKVPFLYGSGVIPNRFEDFKAGIKQLIINEFFNREHIEKFFNEAASGTPSEIGSKIDKDRIFEHLVQAIEESSLGGMLSMVGGKQALEPLREPVKKKLDEILAELVGSKGAGTPTDVLIKKIEEIVDGRLEQLTPQMVKEIVQDMIRKHLGWLVVWGGVFGGLIGLGFSVYEG
jgi:uncharacterized membrane protein YheB (UPF0754 family)